ncbi:MAG: hypothetical protein B9S37_01225 [Verrucomicrobiia bacterium Tous-C3TDCM]|nr:MAG: hypothetical protein B9S37_01225 [Verrucomicrobiae bacterium Tous-C3TDCM]PAZ07072.1 MAG: hypothetical protein CAK88_02120 [Verrucomicrobiae bacterium AMD-G2]
MKQALLPLLFVAALHGQEPAGEPAELLDPIVKAPFVQTEPAPEPQRLEIPPEDIISTKVIFRDGQKITIQKVQPQELEPLPEPAPPRVLTPEEQATRDAARAARVAARGVYRHLMFSCTVYDGEKTMIRWNSQGREPVESFTAWSNVNFHYFNSLGRFKKNDTTYTLMFGIGDTDTAKMASLYARRNAIYAPPVIPALPEDATAEPSFVVTQGNLTPADLEPLVGLHELYKEHHAAMVAEYQRLKVLREQVAAERAANPPDPKPDIIIQHWTIEPKDQPVTNTEGGQAQ